MRPPFGRVGGKSVGYKKLIDLMPICSKYVEVFGGSGVILLNRPKVQYEVFNDLEKGLIDFYLCLQNNELLDKLKTKLTMTVHSRQMWERTHASVPSDRVENAFNWYYTVRNSFGQQGRAFGRSTGKYNADSMKLFNSLKGFQEIHDRLQGVLIECRSFRSMLPDFDSKDTLFYLDPPYMNTFKGAYKHQFHMEDHMDLMRECERCKGRIVLSGYANELYDKQTFWTDRIVWDKKVHASGTHRGNDVANVEEVVWVK